MPFSEIEKRHIDEAFVPFMKKRRPSGEIRDEVDVGYRIEKQSVLIYEIRPEWKNPTRKMESPIAKATFFRSRKLWKIFWMPSDCKWHSYRPMPEVRNIKSFLREVDEDPLSCFWG
jgi:hypothetical protein